MELTVQIPDDVARSMSGAGGDLSRRALEALALEEFKSGHITRPELRRLLGFETWYELDGFLKAHEVYEDYTVEDLERELEGEAPGCLMLLVVADTGPIWYLVEICHIGILPQFARENFRRSTAGVIALM
jgi:hypothetical protein